MFEHIDFDGDRYASWHLAKPEIRDGKIWILPDNTDEGIVTKLLAEGVPKQQIVLGLYPRAVRKAEEFAVA